MLAVRGKPTHRLGVHHYHPVIFSISTGSACAYAVVGVAVFVLKLFDGEALADVFVE